MNQEQNHFCALKKTVAWLSLIGSTIDFVARMHCSVLRKKGYGFLHELNSMLITNSDKNKIYKSFHTKRLAFFLPTSSIITYQVVCKLRSLDNPLY